MVQVGSILGSHVLQVMLVVVVAHVLVVFLVPIYASDFAQGGTIGSGSAQLYLVVPVVVVHVLAVYLMIAILQMVVLQVVGLYMVEVF